MDGRPNPTRIERKRVFITRGRRSMGKSQEKARATKSTRPVKTRTCGD